MDRAVGRRLYCAMERGKVLGRDERGVGAKGANGCTTLKKHASCDDLPGQLERTSGSCEAVSACEHLAGARSGLGGDPRLELDPVDISEMIRLKLTLTRKCLFVV